MVAIQSEKLSATGPTAVGVLVTMSDGTTKTYTLGSWLAFSGATLRAVMPTQYVGQICVLQADGSWKYPAPGRNVQIWRNGLLQRLGADYTLDSPGARMIPVPAYPWEPSDYCTAAYLY